MTLRGTGVRRRREPRERQLTEGGLIPLANQLKDVHALGEIVVRIRRSPRTFVNRASNTQKLAPVGRSGSRIEAPFARLDARFRVRDAVGGDQRFACRKVRLNGLARRHAGRTCEVIGHHERFVEFPLADRELDAQHFERPFVPPHGLRAVGAICLAGVTKVLTGPLVGAAHQMNLRERVEDGARGFMKLDGTADFQRAREDAFRTLELPKLHEDLAERRECDGQAVTRAERLVQRHASLGKRQRLIVLVAHQRHVRLVVDDAREHVIGLNGHREALTLTQRSGGFFAAPGLSEQNR